MALSDAHPAVPQSAPPKPPPAPLSPPDNQNITSTTRDNTEIGNKQGCIYSKKSTSISPTVSAKPLAVSGSSSSISTMTSISARPTSATPGTPTSAELRKLKRRVDPSKRKRIALACDSCKRRKQKCNGDHPCSICTKKNFVCHYTAAKLDPLPNPTPSVTFSTPSPKAAQIEADEDLEPEAELSHSAAATADLIMESKLDNKSSKRHHSKVSSDHDRSSSKSKDQARTHSRRSGSHASSDLDSSDSSASPDTSIPSPPDNQHTQQLQSHQQQQRYHRKRPHSRAEYQVETVGDGRNTRLLWDEKGHLRYMGESGVLSFLEQSRKAFRKVMGDSSFTLDPAQFRFIDGPTHTASLIPLQLPPRSLTNELIQSFEDNVQAFDYVFDMDHLRYQVAQTYRNPMGAPRHWLCLLHFTCALGAIFVSSKQELDTERLNIPAFSGINDLPSNGQASKENSPGMLNPAVFFESGLGLMNDAAEDGELWVVQAYLLMCLYYQIICKRNASWIQLGLAIRFAQALGMHRKCVNMTFPKSQRVMRQRLWRTLYIQDRFWSSSLGRPLAIDDCDWDDRDTSELVLLDRTLVELSKLCEIIGDICLLVYRPQSISSSTSQRLATRLREWSDGLPADIQLSSLNLNNPDGRKLSAGSMTNDKSRKQMIKNQGLLRLHLTHLNSIILLTRPFFLLMVAKTPSEIPSQVKTVSRLSSACVLCAARSVDLVMTFFAQNQQPIRSHLMTYFIFTSGIVLLLESFHQRRSEVESYITRGIFLCIFILGHYGKCDPSAKRYRNILQEMDRAARASRSLNYASNTPGSDSASSQKRQVSQGASLLSSATPAMPVGAETGGTFHFLPTPRNSSVRSEGRPRKMSDEAAVSTPAVPNAGQGFGSTNPEYDDEKYLNDMLGYGYKSVSGDATTNLSRMFLKAAASDGRYQIPDSPGPGVTPPALRARNDDDRGIAIPSSVPPFLPPPAATTGAGTPSENGSAASSKDGTLNISPADAMSQFLMEDTFGVGGSSNEDPNMEFSFDLDMMDWINLASTGTSAAPVATTPQATASANGKFEEAVRRANADLFNGPGGARQGVGATGGSSNGSNSSVGGFYGNDTVFRGLMMNAEY
ncbi:fungal-specific transcription factor domain-containing protein [Lipomyces arxii]|uniref:fungal-specific transcription factor domain-containing protein n=1 Tax=Lipomyces arxii TaxID=56418 RepID=UPI0034CE4B8C